jgi:hypothetical protein
MDGDGDMGGDGEDGDMDGDGITTGIVMEEAILIMEVGIIMVE